jgi:hypothetical protein
MKDNHYLVPLQLEGLCSDIDLKVTAASIEDSEDWFVEAKDRLWNVNEWKVNNGASVIQFRLVETASHLIHKARKGDHIQIGAHEFPGHSEYFDWAVIDAVEYDDYPDENRETFALHLHLVLQAGQSVSDIANPSLTLVIDRSGVNLQAGCHGRNDLSVRPQPEAALLLPKDHGYNMNEGQLRELLHYFLYS